ncbi:MAG: glutaredoxin domain-containing protein [Anaerolineales bacterium]|jgi:mycoredoxin
MAKQKTDPIIVYAHPMCADLRPVQEILRAAGAPFQYVNIHKSEEAMKIVAKINKGNLSVPTLVFPDKTTLTEPTRPALLAKLAKFGYKITDRSAFISSITNLFRSRTLWIMLAILVYALLRTLGVI